MVVLLRMKLQQQLGGSSSKYSPAGRLDKLIDRENADGRASKLWKKTSGPDRDQLISFSIGSCVPKERKIRLAGRRKGGSESADMAWQEPSQSKT